MLEVGSYNVNGSVRPLVEAHGPAAYVGVDQSAGPGVDRVVLCADLVDAFGPGSFDVVISTEMLEHVEDWPATVAQLVDALAEDGLLVITTRSPGFPYHPFPIDTWRYTVDGLAAILAAARLENVEAVPDPQVPGVFATARKPLGWRAPWADVDPAEVLPAHGVSAVVV